MSTMPRRRYNGPDYVPELDNVRLDSQLGRVWRAMHNAGWRTLHEIEAATGDPAASISAQLRHLRKPRFGAHTIEKRSRGDRKVGLYEYRLVVADPGRSPQRSLPFSADEYRRATQGE
jgi:hypothetical protein